MSDLDRGRRAMPPESVRATTQLAGLADLLIRSILPLLLALVAGGALVAALGHNPFDFYLDIYRGGIELSPGRTA